MVNNITVVGLKNMITLHDKVRHFVQNSRAFGSTIFVVCHTFSGLKIPTNLYFM